MKRIKAVATASPNTSRGSDFPFDIVRLLDILARIELRRQARLHSQRAEKLANVL